MRVLIQQKGTGLYFGKYGIWRKHRNQAQSFTTSIVALDFCAQQGLRDVDLLLSFENPKYDVRISDLLSDGPAPKHLAKPKTRRRNSAR